MQAVNRTTAECHREQFGENFLSLPTGMIHEMNKNINLNKSCTVAIDQGLIKMLNDQDGLYL